jgi:kynurenine formamidase
VSSRGADVVARLLESLGSGALEVVDLSHPLSERTPMIKLPPGVPQAPGFELNVITSYEAGSATTYWNSFSGSEHMGTHFDAPVHWISGRDGKDTSEVAGSELIGPAVVIDKVAAVDRNPDYLLTIEDVRAWEAEHGLLPEGGWLLYRTGWERYYDDPDAFVRGDETGSHWPGVEIDCARWLAAETPIRGFGAEQVGTDAGLAYGFDPPYPNHHYLLGAGKYGLGSLANLGRLPPTGSVLVVAPLRIVGGSGSPARIYALVPRA